MKEKNEETIDIKHVASLARLELTAEEEERFSSELSAVLGYVKKLSEINTKKVEPTAQVSGLSDVMRPDDPIPWDEKEVEAALSQGERQDGLIKVKKVL